MDAKKGFRRGIRVQYAPHIINQGAEQKYGTLLYLEKGSLCRVLWDGTYLSSSLNITTIVPTDDFQIITWLWAMEYLELNRQLARYNKKLPSGHSDRSRIRNVWEYLHACLTYPKHITMIDSIPNAGESTRNRIIEMYASSKSIP
jgi:hypothetical protein